MNQSRLSSFYEACINILIGFGINFAANLVVLPQIGCHPSIGDNFYIGFLFTGISLARSYIIRRWFNKKLHEAALKLAREK